MNPMLSALLLAAAAPDTSSGPGTTPMWLVVLASATVGALASKLLDLFGQWRERLARRQELAFSIAKELADADLKTVKEASTSPKLYAIPYSLSIMGHYEYLLPLLAGKGLPPNLWKGIARSLRERAAGGMDPEFARNFATYAVEQGGPKELFSEFLRAGGGRKMGGAVMALLTTYDALVQALGAINAKRVSVFKVAWPREDGPMVENLPDDVVPRDEVWSTLLPYRIFYIHIYDAAGRFYGCSTAGVTFESGMRPEEFSECLTRS